jgi:hypothetical protein
MIRIAIVVLALGACGGRDQRGACTKAARESARDGDEQWIELCVKEGWSDRKIACMQRAGAGSTQSMFCED